ncbi:MAG: ATP-dependent Clp protease adaptor ClpS [Bacteroidales bacterium]
MTREKFNPSSGSQEMEDTLKELILFNDDHNTFDYVVESLVEVCGHDFYQAEQCATIAHHNGKCGVKSGSFYELKPIYEELTNRKLTVSID